MKKFSVLIALALLAVAGTGYAVTCAYDNVPAATLLVPHFRVARNGATSLQDLAGPGTDTLCSVTNVSGTGIMTHFVVWNKFSAMVVDFNVPMTAFDVVTFSMRDILNGHINLNQTQRAPLGTKGADPCGVNQTNASAPYAPSVGFGPSKYIRFSNPDASDRRRAISVYDDPAWPAGSLFRQYVWDSLDESQDVASFTQSASAGILDLDNPACDVTTDPFGDQVWAGDFSGYLTIDVVNYCTLWSASQPAFYNNDAIATVGWAPYGYTPNAIMGDIFYVDPSTTAGNISGDPMVALEFDSRLNDWTYESTFYGRYRTLATVEGAVGGGPTPGTAFVGMPANYAFMGDGREPLGSRYGFRYLSDPTAGLSSWAIIWRSDVTYNADAEAFTEVDLCKWWIDGGPNTEGFFDSVHQITAFVFDNDEQQFQPAGGGCPSPCPGGGPSGLFVFLESERVKISGNTDINPANYKGGWIDMTLPGWAGNSTTGTIAPRFPSYQAYVGIQHTAPGLMVSVGHSATLLNEQFVCKYDPNLPLTTWNGTTVAPIFTVPGNTP